MNLAVNERFGSWLAVALGGVIGSAVRWAVQAQVADTHVDLVTVGLNVVGSMLVGIVLAHHHRLADRTFHLLTSGFAGGLTTFSTFALSIAVRLETGALLDALLHSLGTVFSVLLAAGIGYRLGRLVRS